MASEAGVNDRSAFERLDGHNNRFRTTSETRVLLAYSLTAGSQKSPPTYKRALTLPETQSIKTYKVDESGRLVTISDSGEFGTIRFYSSVSGDEVAKLQFDRKIALSGVSAYILSRSCKSLVIQNARRLELYEFDFNSTPSMIKRSGRFNFDVFSLVSENGRESILTDDGTRIVVMPDQPISGPLVVFDQEGHRSEFNLKVPGLIKILDAESIEGQLWVVYRYRKEDGRIFTALRSSDERVFYEIECDEPIIFDQKQKRVVFYPLSLGIFTTFSIKEPFLIWDYTAGQTHNLLLDYSSVAKDVK